MLGLQGNVFGDEQTSELVIYVDRLQICSDFLATSSDVVGTQKEIKVNSPDGEMKQFPCI